MAKRFGRWETVETLGEGGQAHTFLVRNTDDGSTGWVLKRLKNPKRIDRFKREIEMLTRLQSPHIPAVVDADIGEKDSYLVTAYVGENLTALPDLVEPRAIFERFRGVVTAVHDAHAQGVVHRDIKPDNIVVDQNGKPYLIDFGICADMGSGVMLTTVEGFGNAAFAAPECGAGSLDAAQEASDVYSLGKVLHWMTSRRTVFVRERFEHGSLAVADPHVAQYISAIIDRTVREDPGSRWTSTDLLQGVEWVLAKIGEHSAFKSSGIEVITDGFGPRDECDPGGSRSATGAKRGNPPAEHHVAQSFFVRDPVDLDEIGVGLRLRNGSTGMAEVRLTKGDLATPSDHDSDVLERWPVSVCDSDTVEVLRLQSAGTPTLGPHEIYWVILSATDENSDVEWISAAPQLRPRAVWIAERHGAEDWEGVESVGGPGMAFRVLARPTKLGH
ncbi:serine/threonine protein kinase [Mycobacterium sp. smrl_JER01]|uniref:serine/threonine protein kinase n=1 Tax=Mycobacterium sp. smrl_JER01 TaxID=3402633 RepID=UPI003AC727CC